MRGHHRHLALGLLSLCLPRAAPADFDECLRRHSHDAADATCCVGDNMPCIVEQNGRRLEEALPSSRRKLGHCCHDDAFCECMSDETGYYTSDGDCTGGFSCGADGL